MISPDLLEAVDVYFDAKGRMFADDPDFRVFRAGRLRGFHRHPRWPEQDAFYALDAEPEEVVAAVRAYGPHPQHIITVFADADAPLQEAFANLGYQRMGGAAQPFMQKCLDSAAVAPDGVAVRRVRTQSDVAFINSGGEVMPPSQLNDGVFRYYFIERDGKPVCTGRFVVTPRAAIYVAGMDTIPKYRRHRLATTLMGRMHADAAAEGATLSVLCSSPLGRDLYQSLGYDVLATMHSFIPTARES